ncbi:MAG: CRTAC1 family protein [Pirellulaceae bacterium]
MRPSPTGTESPRAGRSSLGRWRWAITGLGIVALAGLALSGSKLLQRLRQPHTEVAQPSSSSAETAHNTGIDLQDMTEAAGITFVHTHGGSGKMYIVEAMTGGMATFDYDNDGLIDLYFLNGAPLQGTTQSGEPPRNALYRNLGDWKFRDVTHEAAVGDLGFGLGVTVVDYDNDGFPDLYLNNFGPNVLYHNNGDGTFTETTRESGIDPGQAVGAGACFLDIDGDGDVDLYSGNYVKFTYEGHPDRVVGGFLRAQSPADFEADSDRLFRNNGDGTFTDISQESGVAADAGRSMGMVCGDFDNDGDTDIFICNDVMENFYWRNDGTGKFEEVAKLVGVAYDFWGRANGSMGAACADYDHDGWLDIFMTDYQGEMPVLYHNLGQGFFEDVALKAGVTKPLLPHVKWGCSFLDIDNDGDRDLYVGNGHLEPMIHQIDDTTDYRVANVLFRNDGNGTFVDISAQSGSGLAVAESTRGVCADDLDNDGDPDLVMLNQESKPTLLQNANTARPAPHWLQIRLIGTAGNRDGVGSHVTVRAGDLIQMDEVHSGSGYQSHSGMRLQFGLAGRPRVERIEVQWLGGGVDVLEDVAADQLVTIVQGTHPAP